MNWNWAAAILGLCVQTCAFWTSKTKQASIRKRIFLRFCFQGLWQQRFKKNYMEVKGYNGILYLCESYKLRRPNPHVVSFSSHKSHLPLSLFQFPFLDLTEKVSWSGATRNYLAQSLIYLNFYSCKRGIQTGQFRILCIKEFALWHSSMILHKMCMLRGSVLLNIFAL